MESKKKSCTVGDYVTLVRGTTYQGKLVGKPGPVLLGLGSIQPGGGFREDHYKTYGGSCPAELMLFPGDLYVSLKGATKDGSMIGSVARVPNTVSSGRLTQDTVKLVFDESNLENSSYIYWLLRTPHYRNYCAKRATGSAVVALSRKDFLGYPVPPFNLVRSQLVSSFENIDRKIENLRKQNETLEKIAQTLFKHWFVDFEFPNADGKPYKSSGGAMEPSELGDIPADWRVQELGQISEVSTGKGLKRNEFCDDGIYPVLGANGEMGRANKFLKEEKLILTGRVGTLGIVSLSNGKVWISDNVITILPTIESFYFVYFCLRKTNLKLLNRGSTQPLITQGDLKKLIFAIPEHEILPRFEELSLPIFEKVEGNLQHIETLTQTRDVLLPKLMSGKLRIKT